MKALTNVILKGMYTNRAKTKREDALSVLSFIIVFGTLAATMIGASVYLTKRLDESEQGFTFVSIMLYSDFQILFIKGVFETLNSLYFSKDLKILLRMPIYSEDIVHAKLLKMIVSEYEMEIIMLAIPMVYYGIFYKLGLLYFLYIIPISLILPVIPVCLVALVIAVVMRFTNSIKNKSKALYISLFVGFILVDVIVSGFSGNIINPKAFEDAVLVKNGLSYQVADNFKIIKPITDILLNYQNPASGKILLSYILGSIAIYIATVFMISKIYLKGAIGTVVSNTGETIKEENLKLSDFKKKVSRKSYLNKEFITIRRSPIFFIQCLVLPILFSLAILVLAIGMIWFSKMLNFDLISRIRQRASYSWGAGIFISISAIFYMVSFSSIIAISKEEKWAKLSKYLPVKLSKQVEYKLTIGRVTNFIASLSVILFYYVCTSNLKNTGLIFIITILLSNISEYVKIMIDLNNPKIIWENEFEMMKENTNVMYILFYTIVVCAFLIGFSFLIKNLNLYLILVLAILALINIGLYRFIKKNDYKLFEKLY